MWKNAVQAIECNLIEISLYSGTTKVAVTSDKNLVPIQGRWGKGKEEWAPS
jgi:hypothetical protein